MASYYHASQHDISLTPPSGDTLGFVLSRDKSGLPFYYELDSDNLVDLFSTSPTQVSTNPIEELVMGQSDWVAGFGQEYQDTSDPRRYDSSLGMDLSNKGRANLAWGTTAITSTPTMPSAPTIVNANMELETGWTGGARSNAEKYDGTYSWLVQTTTATQNLTGYVPGASYTFKCWCKTNSPATRVSINDGVSTTNGTSHTGGNTWEWLTVTKILDADATGCQLILDAAGAANAYFDVATITLDTAAVAGVSPSYCQAEAFSYFYIALGTQLCALNAGGTAFNIAAIFPAAITCLTAFQVSGADYLFVFLGTGNDYHYMSAGGVIVQSTAAVKAFQYGAWVNTTVDTLYANDGNNTIRSTTNPLNGGVAWSAVTYVGEASKAITHLLEKDGALLIDKSDMPYYLSSTGTVQKDLAPETKTSQSTTSGKNSVIWKGEYFRPTGTAGLLRIGDTNEWIQPQAFTENQLLVATTSNLVGDDEWLYDVSVSSDGNYVIYWKGRDQTIDGVTRWLWHPFHYIAIASLASVGAVYISTVYQKRLWVFSGTAANSIRYLPLPTKYGDVFNDSNRSYLTGGYFEPPWMHGDFPSENKALIKLTCTMGHTYDADIYFNVNYKKLGDSSWSATTLKFDGSATSMIETNYFEVATTGRTSPMIKLKFAGVTDDTTKTPILLDYKISCLLMPPKKDVILSKVKVMEEMTNNEGLTNNHKSLQMTCLENMRDATWLTTMTDLSGTTRYVKCLNLPKSPDYAWKRPIRKEVGRQIEWEYTLLLLSQPLA